ncbi:MAG: dienelactone hydrolase family protein [Sneathiella sp.]|nr:dienelactone hydrolase family protein [Sneathiella sp.]
MGEWIDLTAADGHTFSAYISKGEDSSKGGIVITQEIFGVNSHIQDLCDRYAKCGYTAIAPALFDRLEKDVFLEYNSDGVEKGLQLKHKIDDKIALIDIEAAKDHIQNSGVVSIVGYCWGGTLAYLTACNSEGFSKAVCYYGGGIAGLKEKQPQIPTLLHFGDQDTSIPMTDVDAIMNTRPETQTYLYQAEHGFNCDKRGSYNASAAKLALSRTLNFIG